MGISDREYYQDEDRREGELFRLPRSVVVITLILWIGTFVLNLFLRGTVDLFGVLALAPDAWRRPWELLGLVTASTVHYPQHVLGLIFYSLFLYFLGTRLEQVQGSRGLAVLMLTGTVVGNAIWLALTNIMVGATPPDPIRILPLASPGAPLAAVTMLFCLKYPFEKAYLFGLLQLPIWVIGVFYFVGDIFAALASVGGAWTGGAWPATFGGALVGFLWWRFVPATAFPVTGGYGTEDETWDTGSNWVDPMQGVRPSWWSSLKASWKTKRAGLKLHKPTPDESDAEDEPGDPYQALDEQADIVLDKIRRLGESSLTAAERRTLEAYSRRMRQKLR